MGKLKRTTVRTKKWGNTAWKGVEKEEEKMKIEDIDSVKTDDKRVLTGDHGNFWDLEWR